MGNHLPLLLLLLLTAAGCRLDPGDACETTGEGFTRFDPCSTQCISWPVPCANGTTEVPYLCAGTACSDDAGCPSGFGCAKINATDAVCLLDEICPRGFEAP